jgi:hypothetical protein
LACDSIVTPARSIALAVGTNDVVSDFVREKNLGNRRTRKPDDPAGIVSDAGAEQIDQLMMKLARADRLCDLAQPLKPVFIIQAKQGRLAMGCHRDIMCHGR